jgi:hypothetical protein
MELCSEVADCPENRWCGNLGEASRNPNSIYKLAPETDIWQDTDTEDLNFGYSSFNHLPSAFLTIF